MEKLRSEIRAAFEKEQAAHPPITALRQNVVEAVTAQPWRDTNYQWLAVAAALLLGILVVVGLMSTRFAPRASVPANPKAASIPDYGLPPAGVPLLYLMDSNYVPSWRIGYDWEGHPRGTLKLDSYITAAASPDGQFFAVLSQAGAITFLDRLGKPIPGPDGLLDGVIVARSGRWADDNRHVCRMYIDQKTFEWTLNTQLPGEAAKPVSAIIRDQNISGLLQPITVASCSFRNNQAVLTRLPEGSRHEVWVIRLSDGKEISHHDVTGTQGMPIGIVASTDGAYIAENFSPGLPTQIRRVADWTVVATLAQGETVAAFSGNDSLVLVLPGPKIVDWRSGVWVWRDNIGLFEGAVTEPSGSAFALQVPHGIESGPLDVLIVRGDGTTISIPRHGLPAEFFDWPHL